MSAELRKEAQTRYRNLEMQNVWSPLPPPRGMMSGHWEAGRGDLTSTRTQTGNDPRLPSPTQRYQVGTSKTDPEATTTSYGPGNLSSSPMDREYPSTSGARLWKPRGHTLLPQLEAPGEQLPPSSQNTTSKNQTELFKHNWLLCGEGEFCYCWKTSLEARRLIGTPL